MSETKPVIAVAALIAVIVGEGWLRSKMHQFDEDYVGLANLISSSTQMRRKGKTWALRQLPESSARTYRGSSFWLPASDIPSKEGQPGR